MLDSNFPEEKVFIAADHRGRDLLNYIIAHFPNFVNLGNGTNPGKNADPEDDFNDAAIAVARKIQENPDSRGVLICGSAHGIAMQANRFQKIRAIAAYNPQLAKIGRQHNDANVLCLSADFTEKTDNLKIIETFLSTPFLRKPRYLRRNLRLDENPVAKAERPETVKNQPNQGDELWP